MLHYRLDFVHFTHDVSFFRVCLCVCALVLWPFARIRCNLNLCALFLIVQITKFSNEFHKTVLCFMEISRENYVKSILCVYMFNNGGELLLYIKAPTRPRNKHAYIHLLIHSKQAGPIRIDFSIRIFRSKQKATSTKTFSLGECSIELKPFNETVIKRNQVYCETNISDFTDCLCGCVCVYGKLTK